MLIVLVVMVSMVGVASATTVWNPAANDITPPDVGDWGDADNWTNGVPMAPDGATKAVFNVEDAAEAQVSGEYDAGHLVQGDGGPGGVIRVMDGGTLNTRTDGWSSIGWNNVANLVVESGGTFNFGHHAWIGFNDGSEGTVEVYGTVTVAEQFGLGWEGTGTGYVNVNDGGLLELSNWHPTNSITGDSVLTINEGGVVVIAGDRVDNANNFFDNGFIASDLGAIEATYDDGFTTIVAIPEPATVGLLGLGGLTLLRKKK